MPLLELLASTSPTGILLLRIGWSGFSQMLGNKVVCFAFDGPTKREMPGGPPPSASDRPSPAASRRRVTVLADQQPGLPDLKSIPSAFCVVFLQSLAPT